MHVPQSIPAEIELKNLMQVKKLIVTAQTNSPVMGIVQDALVGSYLMTRKNIWMDKDLVCNCLMTLNQWKIPIPAILKPLPKWSGLQLFSILFPPNFQFTSKVVIIRQGEALTGPFSKKQLGRTDGNVIHQFYLHYGSDRTVEFFNNCQRLVNYWLTTHGFSTGIGDCVVDVNKDDIEPLLQQIDYLRTSENDINQSLNRIRDNVGTAIQQQLSPFHGMKCMVESGSKGSMVNICQIAGCVGQQNIEGKRIPFRFSNRTLPHFSKGDNGSKARGFIRNSYYDGLTPTEFFFHAMAGREGIIDTACKTATTGYTERKLVKNMEDLKVEYDQTVRNQNGDIYEFLYGEDGLDASYLRTVQIPTFLPQKNLLPHVLPKYYSVVQKERELLFQKFDQEYISPVYIEPILQQFQDIPGILATPLDIIQGYQSLFNHNLYWNDYCRRSLSFHRFEQNGGVSLQSLNGILIEIQRKYDQAVVAPGEMVGVLAAQSISEPATQMTLNTFHFTGISSKNVTLGVPRLLELLHVSKNQKTPSMTITPINPLFYLEIPQRQLKDFCINIQFLFLAQTTPHLKKFSECFGLPSFGTKGAGRWGIQYQVHPNLFYYISFERLGDLICSSFTKGKVQVCFTTCWHSKPYILFYVSPRLSYATANLNILHILRKLDTFIQNFCFHGVKGIKDFYRHENYIETSGINIKNLLTLPGHDKKQLTCNDPHIILQHFGIEAARTCLLQEIKKILSFDGSYVNARHLSLLVNVMTHTGTLTPINRYGLNQRNPSTLSQATFEQVTSIFAKGAMKATKDPIKGVSENILLGNLVPMGTGLTGALLDEEKLQKAFVFKHTLLHKYVYEQKKPQQNNPFAKPGQQEHGPFATPQQSVFEKDLLDNPFCPCRRDEGRAE